MKEQGESTSLMKHLDKNHPLVAAFLADKVPSPRNPIFDSRKYGPLPGWVKEIRPAQWEVAKQIVEAFGTGKKVVILDAPTGSGKTLVAELVRRMMNAKAIYSCSTKTLQDQFAKDFPYCSIIKGRENYPTLDHPERFESTDPLVRLTAADCVHTKEALPACPACLEHGEVTRSGFKFFEDESGTGGAIVDKVMHCPWCHPAWLSPYVVAKEEAVAADLAVMNTAYFLGEVNMGGTGLKTDEKKGRFYGRPLVIFDEADLLESQLMSAIELSISPRRRRNLGIQRPFVKTMQAKGHIPSWVGWAAQSLGKVKARITSLGPIEATDIVKMRERRYLDGLRDKLERLIKEIPSDGWVYTDYETNMKNNEDNFTDPVSFRPIFVNKQAPAMLWENAERFLLMSATMLSGEQVAMELGIPDGDWHMVSMPSSFPKENRPIFVSPKADMTNKLKDQERPKMVAAIDEILDRYPDERVLVHTVSYDLTRYIMDNSKRSDRMMTYLNAKERDSQLKVFRNTVGAVMLAPSFDRGVDLRDDDCRVVIVAKIPYPYLGDKQVSARLYSPGGAEWYHIQTIRSIMQMTGRGVRHEKDWADTFILDAQFMSIWQKRQNWFPRWWKEAIIWSDRAYGRESASRAVSKAK